MSRTPPDPETVKLVLEAAATGMSDADIAAEMKAAGLKISVATVGVWRLKYGQGKRTEASPAVAAKLAENRRTVADTSADEADLDADPLTGLRKMQAQLQRDARAYRETGNTTAAQRSMTAAAGLAPVIARLLKASKEDSSVERYSRAEIEAAGVAVEDRMRKILDRPLLCAECSRKLSIDWGHGDSEAAPVPRKGER